MKRYSSALERMITQKSERIRATNEGLRDGYYQTLKIGQGKISLV